MNFSSSTVALNCLLGFGAIDGAWGWYKRWLDSSRATTTTRFYSSTTLISAAKPVVNRGRLAGSMETMERR